MIAYVHLRRSLPSLICCGRMVVEPGQVRRPTPRISQRTRAGLIVTAQCTGKVSQTRQCFVTGSVGQQTRVSVDIGVITVGQRRHAPVLNLAVVKAVVFNGPST